MKSPCRGGPLRAPPQAPGGRQGLCDHMIPGDTQPRGGSGTNLVGGLS